MTNALTLAQTNELTITKVRTLDVVQVKSGRNMTEALNAVRDAYASVSDIKKVLRIYGMSMKKADLETVAYALARARYREDYDLSIEQVALLVNMTVEKVRKYFKRLQVQVGEMVTNHQTSRLLSAVADYD